MELEPFGPHRGLESPERFLGALGDDLRVRTKLRGHHDHQPAPAVDAALAEARRRRLGDPPEIGQAKNGPVVLADDGLRERFRR